MKPFDIKGPLENIPPAMLAPDGRYSCDRCDFLCERSLLVERPDGFICPECILEEP
jgi:hypothetical protein